MDFFRKLLIYIVFLVALVHVSNGVLSAQAVDPCTDGANNEAIIPVRGQFSTYCVSTYGWSDTWFLNGTQPNYVQSLDVLSGDDVPFMRWTGAGSPGLNDSVWISPSFDKGTLAPVDNPNHAWTTVSPVAYTSGNSQAQSVISQPVAGLTMTITTTALDYGVILSFRVQNTGSNTLTDVQFGDYFNYHPNGSDTATQATQGQVFYVTDQTSPVCPHGCIFSAGNTAAGTNYLGRPGYMWGSRAPDIWILGSARSSIPGASNDLGTLAGTSEADRVWRRVETNDFSAGTAAINGSADSINQWPFNYPSNTTNRGDAAGAFVWNIGSLNPGDEFTFELYKVATPEPGTLALFALGLAGIVAYRRRKRA